MPTRPSSVSREDVTLHYRVFGDGPPILLLSGGPGGPSDELLPIATMFEKDYRVVLLDQRGTGASALSSIDSSTINMAAYVDDVEVVRKELGFPKWALLGHSAGGGVAMSVAAAHPQTVSALILVESAGLNLDFVAEIPSMMRHTDEEKAAMEHWGHPERMAEDPVKAGTELYRAWVSGTVHDRSHVDRVLEGFVPERDTMKIADLLMRDLMAQGFDLREPLGNLPAPALVVSGRQGLMGPSTGELIAKTIPNANFEVLEDCGHYPMYEQPAAFYAAVGRFLEKTLS